MFMKQQKKMLLILLVCFLFTFPLCATSESAFPPFLPRNRDVIRIVCEELNKPVQDITEEDIASITTLRLPDCGIKDISFLEYYTGLGDINLSGNNITDISPIASLKNLRFLNLNENYIEDLSPLSDLPFLLYLFVNGNRKLSDLTPLKNLETLKSLYADSCRIKDLSPLSNLSQLQGLFLSYNQIEDISMLSTKNLYSLGLAANPIKDWSSLSTQSRLFYLELSWNTGIRDLSFIRNCTEMEVLRLDGIGLQDVEFLRDLNLEYLTTLTLSHNQITGIEPLSSLSTLSVLSIEFNEISDISPLMGLKRLFLITYGNNPLSNEKVEELRQQGVECYWSREKSDLQKLYIPPITDDAESVYQPIN